jgi:hypothetical protein
VVGGEVTKQQEINRIEKENALLRLELAVLADRKDADLALERLRRERARLTRQLEIARREIIAGHLRQLADNAMASIGVGE